MATVSTAPAAKRAKHGLDSGAVFVIMLWARGLLSLKAFSAAAGTSGASSAAALSCPRHSRKHIGRTCTQCCLLYKKCELSSSQAGVVAQRHELRPRVAAVPC